MSVVVTPTEIFKELKRSSAYNPTVSEETKLQILCDSWQGIYALVEKSDTGGMSNQPLGGKSDPSDNFGYIAEALAASDPDFSHNSSSGEELAKIMLEAMRNGSRRDQMGFKKGRLRNPDFIWIKLRGRKATVWGIGEVKSSGSAFVAGRDKMFLQENSVREIVKAIMERRKEKSHPCFAGKRIVIKSPLKKVLIVPYGMDKKCFLLPDGWEVANLKFTYDELLFIAKQIWPDFRPQVRFKKNPLGLGKEKYDFLDWFLKWGEAKLRHIVPASAGMINLKKLFLFVCATGKLPAVVDMQVAVSTVSNESLKRLHSYPNDIMEECEWGDKGTLFFKKFSAVVGVVDDQEDLWAQIKIFLTNFRIFSAGLSGLCKNNKIMEEIIRCSSPFSIMVFKV